MEGQTHGNTLSMAQFLLPMAAALAVFAVVSAGGLTAGPSSLLGDSALAGVLTLSLAAGAGCGVGVAVAYVLVPAESAV